MKKKKILLFFPDTGEKYMFNVPLSLIWVAAPLVENGYDVRIFDQRFDRDYKGLIRKMANDLVCVGVSSLTGFQLHGAIEVSRWIKAQYPGIPVVWGGWHVSILTEQSIQAPFIDYIIQGQGELPLLDLVEHLNSGRSPGQIPNLAYRENGRGVVNAKRPLIDINTLPMKPYHLVDLARYEGRRLTLGDRYLAWMSSVGCPFRCAFCADPLVYERRWLALAPTRMADEIQQLVTRFGITQFGFWDDNFFIDLKRVEQFVDLILARDLRIKWTGTIRISGIRRIPMPLLLKCKQAGLHMVHPGVEGATQPMLDYMDKMEKAEDTVPAAEKLKRAGIKSLFSFIVGLPDEPASNVQDTFDMIEALKRINPENIMPVNFYTPYPGNRLYDISCRLGFRPPQTLEAWADFNTRVGITPWLTERYRQEVMKRDKYYYPAAYPSQVMRNKMRQGSMRHLYRLLHKIAAWRVKRGNFKLDLDWKLLYAYWRFWAKYNRKLRLHNINFRW